MLDIIYIEDDDTEALVFKMGLASRGINVLHIADSRPESLTQLDETAYRAALAIFIDQWIGTTSGMELARMLRGKGDTRPFFLLTAGENTNPDLLKELNVTFLQKPQSLDAVARMVKEIAGE